MRRAHGGVEGVVSDPDKPKNKRLRDYIASKIAPDTNASPYASTVPRRDGVGYDTCVGRLRDAGFGDIEHIALDDWATRDDLGAGEVVSVQDAGQNRDTGQPIGVATNPSTKPAPIAAPPDIDEDTANPCDLNPGGTHSDPAAAHEHGVFDVFDDGYPIASPRGTADTFLPWGATWLAGTNWAGFGYSKILAKHGWTPDDAAQTRAVLAEPQHSYVRQGNGRDRYLGLAKADQSFWAFASSGRPQFCIRAVVVEPNNIGSFTRPSDGATDIQPSSQDQTGIWTSFGARAGYGL